MYQTYKNLIKLLLFENWMEFPIKENCEEKSWAFVIIYP